MTLGTHELIDHTGDLAIRVTAPSFDALLETAALALFELLLDDRTTVDARTSVDIPIDNAQSEEVRLKGLLSELLYRFEVDRFVLANITIESALAHCMGERFDPARHSRTRSIKAVTYHGLAVTRDDAGGCSAAIVFDI
ncbi:MAG: archease [Deltaproteobacteria bacterium]|nr:archease [Deltaproteobacteria bacterium]